MVERKGSLLDQLINTPELARLDAEEELILSVSEQLLGALRKSGLSKADVARGIGCSPAHITQTLSGSRNMTLRTAAAIAWAAGQRVEVSVVPAPGSACHVSGDVLNALEEDMDKLGMDFRTVLNGTEVTHDDR